MQDDEGLSVAGREGRARLDDAVLGAGRLGRVAGDEVVRRLLGRQARDGREDTVGVARQEDEVGRLVARHAALLVVLDEVNRLRAAREEGSAAWTRWTGGRGATHVGAARVLGDADVVVVGHAVRRVIHDVLEDRAEADGIEDLGLLLLAGGEQSWESVDCVTVSSARRSGGRTSLERLMHLA